MPPGFDRLESFGHDELTAEHWGAQGLLMLMGSKFLIKMTGRKTLFFILMFCGLVMLIKNFDPINIRRHWAPEITMFCLHDQNFQAYQNQEALAAHLISHLFQEGLFSSWPPFFTPGVFLIRFYFFFDPSGWELDSSMTSYSNPPFKVIAWGI